MSDPVWIAGETIARSRCYHTDPDCADLAMASDPKQRTKASCKGHIPECQACTGDKWGHNDSHIILKKLIQMDPEEALP